MTINVIALSPTPTPTPTITSFTPTFGLATGGTVVTITGGTFKAGDKVYFGTVPATTTFVNSNQLTAIAPTVSGTSNVSVNLSINNGLPSSTQFTYYATVTEQATAAFNAEVKLPAGTEPTTLTATMLNGYFATLFNSGLPLTPAPATAFLAARLQFMETLFANLSATYGATADASILMTGTLFPYTPAELPGSTGVYPMPSVTGSATNNYIDTTVPKQLVNYAQQTYVTGDNNAYVTMPNVIGNTYTHVYTNGDYIQTTVINETPSYQSKLYRLSSDSNYTPNNFTRVTLDPGTSTSSRLSIFKNTKGVSLAQGYLMITSLGTGVNWAELDKTSPKPATYGLYTIISYNSSFNITGTGGTVSVMDLISTSAVVPAQQLMTLQTPNTVYKLMGGSVNELSSVVDTTPLPQSNICFPAGTPIRTDQGRVPIELLQTDLHTIQGKPLLGITKTVALDKYLIAFEANAMGKNIPNQRTLMSKDHQIFFQGQLVPAYRFLDYSDKVHKVNYTGEVLYNVLMAEHGLLDVNNLTCETLHPENVIAKLQLSPYTQSYKNNVVQVMNESLRMRDAVAYKSIVNRHF